MRHDRTVHGLTTNGHPIVRYAVSGKWYIEGPRTSNIPRRHVTVRQAAHAAAQGTHYPGRPGGTVFDRLVSKEQS